MKIRKIISDKIKKITDKVVDKVQEIILYFYPEIKKFPEATKQEKIRLDKKELLKIAIIIMIPVMIAGAYIILPLKIVNILFLASYTILVFYRTFGIYKREKKITRRIAVNMLLLLAILLFGTYAILK